MTQYIQSARMACFEKTNGGVLQMMPDLLVKAFTLIPQVFLWRSVILSGAQVDMTLQQMLAYTYLGVLLSDLLLVRTAASGWLSEGVIMRLYGRPLSVLGQLAAQTIGGWIPTLAFFSLPMALLSPLLGIILRPASPWWWLSLALCVSLGFAIDILFACLSIKLRNMNWLISRIRIAIAALFSGTVIPIQLLPDGFAAIVRLQPFACLGGAPLALFTGIAQAADILPLQLFWNAVLWPVALMIFRKSEEGLVSYGG